MHKRLTYVVAGIALIVTALVYWPVVHANFVWDDWLDFHDMPWLRQGDEWKHFIFRDYNGWTNYFRPLGVALLTLQVRLFGDAPGPMHAVSLGMHLLNTLLVGLLSWRCGAAITSVPKRTYLLAVSMLLYGLHPALIEPVSWISSQFDLVVTMFMLLGLLANACIKGACARPTVVAILFFLAACTKESAVSFPLMLVVFDWAVFFKRHDGRVGSAIRAFISRNWPVYVAMLFAGIVYLSFRHWAIGKIVNPFAGSSFPVFARLQEACFIYLHYWKTLIWPMSGMSPIHPVDVQQFNLASPSSVLVDLAAIGIVATGLYLALRRSSTTGCMIVAMTVALLPVLHVASANFDSSLYHDRYVITALAVVCAMLPLLRLRMPIACNRARFAFPLSASIIFFWFVFAVIDIRATLPLWSNNVNLWQWALTVNPDSVEAKDSLLSAYIDTKDYANAHKLIDQLLADHVQCANCMLNAAILAVTENDPARAAVALEEVKTSREVATDKKMLRMYILATGETLVLQGHLEDAEQLLRIAMKMDPLDPQPKLSLAIALALQGRKDEALIVGESAIVLLPLDERGARRKKLDDTIASGIRSARPTDQSTKDH